ncbi:MAG: putative toxin-antitoxin system toxin component, PIN family [Candidatus Omnitrophica bacterium]|nr:putative toxin-antitoxin system toxin component, PIN family [Candidatus Omnitrophota bacterium]
MKKELRAVIDTNVIISAAIGKSAVFTKIYDSFVNSLFTPVLSVSLREEIFGAVRKPSLRKYFRAEEMKRFRELIKVDTLLVTPSKKIVLCRDAKDNIVLEAALEAKADLIVTGDKDLLCLNPFQNIRIITPKEFVDRLK